MTKRNLYKVEYTDYSGARIVICYVADLVNEVSDTITKYGSDVVITSLGRVNVLN